MITNLLIGIKSIKKYICKFTKECKIKILYRNINSYLSLPGNDLGPPDWNVDLHTVSPLTSVYLENKPKTYTYYQIPVMKPSWHYFSLKPCKIIWSLNSVPTANNSTNSLKLKLAPKLYNVIKTSTEPPLAQL